MNKKILPLILVLSLSLLAASCASSAKKTEGDTASTGPTAPTGLWSLSDPAIDAPESAYYDAESGQVFVSNVSGSPVGKDGKGWITVLDTSGKIVKGKWVEGLNAPKGLRSYKGTLWVSDIDTLVGIKIKGAKISQKISIKGAKFLNDVAIGPQGEVYVSDMMGDRIYVVKNGKVSVFFEGPEAESPNGLLVDGGSLLVAGWGKGIKGDFSSESLGNLFRIDLKTKKKQLVTKSPLGHLDGLEKLASGDYVVSDWMAGKVLIVSAKSGDAKVIYEGFKGSADLGLLQRPETILVPRMGENVLSAFVIPAP